MYLIFGTIIIKYVIIKIKGKGAKIVIVNLKMCNYKSGKLKGAKL